MTSSSVVHNLDLATLAGFPAVQFPAALSVQTNSTEAKNVYVGVIPSEVVDARMVLVRVTETGSATYESAVITHADWNTAARTDQEITLVLVDPDNPGELYVAISEAYGAAGETWLIFRSGSSIQNLKDVAMHAGTVHMATGYEDAGQQSASDFIHFGASATGGGMGHAWICYNPDHIETTRGYFSRACHWEDVSKIDQLKLMDSHTSIPYYAVYSNTPDQLKAMTFMYLDGFYASTISADTVSLADEFKNEITYDFTRVMADADDDGLPDDWETANGFDPSNGADADGDGSQNLAEYTAGTNLKDANFLLKITAIEKADPGVIVKFDSVTGRLYTLEYSDDPASGTWTVLQADIPGTGAVIDVADPASPGKRLYRVKARIP